MDADKLAIDLLLKGMTQDQQTAALESIKESVAQAKAVQKQRIGENVQVVVQALKKIEADIRSRYDDVGDKIEKRVATIKDGRDGLNGKDGRDGKDGRNGEQGPRGLNGLPGRDGVDGRDGENGVSVTDAHIDFDGSLIISLSSGRQINVGEVVASDLAEKIKVITNGGGTSQGVLDTLTSLQTQIDNIPGGGDVVGPASATNSSLVAFDGTTGKLIKQAATVTVAQGGTGAASLAANNVLLGNGTSAVQVVAPGTTGNVLTSDGTTWVSAASAGGAAATPTTLGTVFGRTVTGLNGNTALGYNASAAITTGTNNVAIGDNAGSSATVGSYNVHIGTSSGKSNVSQSDVVSVGAYSLQNLTTGYGNTAFGSSSLSTTTTGQYNTAIGSSALAFPNATVSNNTAVGYDALGGNTSGENNTSLGAFAGNNITTGSNNTVIGYNADASSATVSNEITIGNASITSFRIPGLSVNWTTANLPNVNDTATQTLTNKTIEAGTLTNGYTEEVFAVTGTTPALSPTNGSIQTWTLSGNSTPTAGTWADGQSLTLMIDDGSASTITWTSLAVTWKTNGGAAPTLNTTGFTVIQLWEVGSVIYGARVGDA
jgi:hypothetical protein